MLRRRAATIFVACLSVSLTGCGPNAERAEHGVDTTLPDNPGKLTGTVSYPSDELPKDLKVCAQPLPTGEPVCTAVAGNSYSLDVPEGEYQVFAQTAGMPGVRAYYSDFVECGYNSWCSSHEPIKVAIGEGQTRSGVNPGDWYRENAEPTDMSAVDENIGDETQSAPTGDTDTGESTPSEDGDTAQPTINSM